MLLFASQLRHVLQVSSWLLKDTITPTEDYQSLWFTLRPFLYYFMSTVLSSHFFWRKYGVANRQENLSSTHTSCLGPFFLCTQGLHLEPLHQLIFVIGFFEIKVLQTICLGWL
jgi:hypothetical protein